MAPIYTWHRIYGLNLICIIIYVIIKQIIELWRSIPKNSIQIYMNQTYVVF